MSRKAQKKRSLKLTHPGRLFYLAFITLYCLVTAMCIKSFIDLEPTIFTQLSVMGPAKSNADSSVIADSRESYSVLMNRYDTLSTQLNQYKKELEDLKTKNSELSEDNVALQNTLKMAASAGVKPQNYTRFKGIESRGGLDRGEYIGRFYGTAYTPSKDECGNNKGITNSGIPIMPGMTIAVDKKYWPFGTVFYIKGLGYAIAMDTGSAIKGKYRFDFSVFDKEFAGTLGARYWDVYLVSMGKGYVEAVDILKK